jgi:hypothetical protein
MITIRKHAHSFFPSGKGLVIIDKDVTLLYMMSGADACIYYTQQPYEDINKLNELLDSLNSDTQYLGGFSQSAFLEDLLDELPNETLAAMYLEVVGYDPFAEDPKNPEAAKTLVIEYMTMQETLDEVFL